MCLCEIINPRNVSDAPTVKFCCCHRTLLSSIEKRKGLYPPILFILTVAFLQFSTSPFLPAHLHLFSHQLKFFLRGQDPLRSTPGPWGTCPGYPTLSECLAIYIIIYFAIYIIIIVCYMYYTAYRVSHVNAHPQFLGHLEKLFFHLTCLFACVPLFADRFRHLSDGFRPYNIVDSTLTSGLRYRQHLTVL